MAEHFLLSASSRDFSRADLESWSEDEILKVLSELRWGSRDSQVCPSCGQIDRHYWRAARKQWRCKGCQRDFSITSGTAFSHRKLPLKQILRALFSYVVSVKGIAACQLSRELACTWKTAWLLTCKCREAIIKQNQYSAVQSVAQLDGGYFGGKRRAANKHGSQRDDGAIAAKLEDPRSMRKKRKLQLTANDKANLHRKRKRRTVFVLREIDPRPGYGASRTMVSVAMSENETDATEFARRFIANGVVVMTDESGAFAPLSLWTDHRTVVHSREYVSDDGTNDNQAESFFSRMRRGEYGVFHGFRPMYLIDYASEFAWRDDRRRKSVGDSFRHLLASLLSRGHSRWWAGYYQGNRRQAEILGPADASIATTRAV
jgi:transposase-like protein